jgi:UDP-N-acetylmuramoyl-L-alanyl-D-glutamate--2,6-diaminopimelate ligase
MNDMVTAGVEYCFMEVSSHAIHQHRIESLEFQGGIFTNITHDHLDYHKTFAEYIKAKKAFFDSLSSNAFALINSDDKNGAVMVQNSEADIKRYSVNRMADFKAKVLEPHLDGTLILLDGKEIWIQLIGLFNVYNALAVYGTCRLLGVSEEEALQEISRLTTVNGRFQPIRSQEGKTAIIDYAHTPDALLNVLQTIKQIKTENQKIITVVGAGGNRDNDKRPVMAKIAADYSNTVILTSDNPRDEEPDDIIEDMQNGVRGISYVLSITNRKEAIKTAIHLATDNDVVLVAGKGHETYQEIKGVKHHFDDKEVVAEFLKIK